MNDLAYKIVIRRNKRSAVIMTVAGGFLLALGVYLWVLTFVEMEEKGMSAILFLLVGVPFFGIAFAFVGLSFLISGLVGLIDIGRRGSIKIGLDKIRFGKKVLIMFQDVTNVYLKRINHSFSAGHKVAVITADGKEYRMGYIKNPERAVAVLRQCLIRWGGGASYPIGQSY